MAYSYFQFWRRRRILDRIERATAAILSNLTISGITTTGATFNVDTNEENQGTLYWFVSTSATPPSLSDLKAGTGATQAGNQAVASNPQSASATTLTTLTTYYVYITQTDEDGNDSNIISDTFTTL